MFLMQSKRFYCTLGKILLILNIFKLVKVTKNEDRTFSFKDEWNHVQNTSAGILELNSQHLK